MAARTRLVERGLILELKAMLVRVARNGRRDGGDGACRFATTADEGAELAVGGGWLVYSDGNAIWARKTTGGVRMFVKSAGGTVERVATDGTSPRRFITSPTPIEGVTDITQVHIRAPYMYWSTNTCSFDGGRRRRRSPLRMRVHPRRVHVAHAAERRETLVDQ